MQQKDRDGFSLLDYAFIYQRLEIIGWCIEYLEIMPEALVMLELLIYRGFSVSPEIVPVLRILYSGYFPEIDRLEDRSRGIIVLIRYLDKSLGSDQVLHYENYNDGNLLRSVCDKLYALLGGVNCQLKGKRHLLKKIEAKIQDRLLLSDRFIQTYPDLQEQVFKDELLWATLNEEKNIPRVIQGSVNSEAGAGSKDLDAGAGSYRFLNHEGYREDFIYIGLSAYYGKEEGAQYTIFNNGMTPLHMAALGGQKLLVAKLLDDSEYDFGTRDNKGSCFEEYLIRGGHLELVKKYILVETVNDLYTTLSDVAFIYNRPHILEYFVEKKWPKAKLYFALLNEFPSSYREAKSYQHFIELFSHLLSFEEVDALTGNEIFFVVDTFKKCLGQKQLNSTINYLHILPKDRDNFNRIEYIIEKINDILKINQEIIRILISNKNLNFISNLIRALIESLSPERNLEQLGEGSYGLVYKMTEKTGEQFALKIHPP
jgi:hypothetical protein